MTIGERIKQRRKELGLSVEDIADKLGKSRATVYRYETDDVENMPISILEPLAKILDTTPVYLMGWTGYCKTNNKENKDFNEAINGLNESNQKFIMEMINKLSNK